MPGLHRQDRQQLAQPRADKSEVDVLVLGGGPAGLGCAWLLNEHGGTNWLLCEQFDSVGGLSRSILDDAGYTWDLGGHVCFPSDDTFLAVLDLALGPDDLASFERKAYVASDSGQVPYPFQNNLGCLPAELGNRCLAELQQAAKDYPGHTSPDFASFMQTRLGSGITEMFMKPYNDKLWGYPLNHMSCDWVGDVVSIPNGWATPTGTELTVDRESWGANRRFSYPSTGGIGAIWRAICRLLPTDNVALHTRAIKVDHRDRVAEFADGSLVKYRRLVSSLPVDKLAELLSDAELSAATSALVHSSLHAIGLGVTRDVGRRLGDTCWMYFPNPKLPFYRVTNLSHYSRNMVPERGLTSSLLIEVSDSKHRPVDARTVLDDTIHGLVEAGILLGAQEVLHTWLHREEYAYPTPTLHRDGIMRGVHARLEHLGIESCGRFGAWRYEAGNMEQCFMQGHRAAENILTKLGS